MSDRALLLFVAIATSTGVSGCDTGPNEHEMNFTILHDAYLSRFQPLQIEKERAWWNASTSGSEVAFKAQEEAQNKIVELHSDPDTFSRLNDFKKAGHIRDPMLRRQLEVMHRSFRPGQADTALQKRIVALETEVERIFTNHRSAVGTRKLSENDVRAILESTADSAEAEAAWKGYMEVGKKVEDRLREAVKLRNELARKLDYPNFYTMQLDLQEIEESELLALMDELDRLTIRPFTELKEGIDADRAANFGIQVADLRPWHFGDLFFQETPPMPGADLNEVYAKEDLLELTRIYYEGLGMEVDDIIERSDLYERPGKNSHAFAVDIDREGDTRVLCNLQPNVRWADTLIHELGHAVYDKYIDRKLPFLLRTPSHSITTEGYAMMVGAMAKNQEFLTEVVKLPAEEAQKYVASAKRSLKAEKLIFSRWAQVMVRFEHGMYNDPDQDLGKLWWDLKKRYQLLNPPEDVSRPDYGAKIHIVTVPVYYHSYLLGDLFASQVHHHIATEVLDYDDVSATCYHNSLEAGQYMKREIFEPGNVYAWNELTRRATGEKLTPKYFVRQYVE